MLALCAKAAHEATRDGAAASAGAMAPLAVSANFLGAPDPGPVRLVTAVRKRGRRISVVDVELIQADRTAVRAAVTVGVPEEQAEPLLVGQSRRRADDTGSAAGHRADRPGPSDGRDRPPGGRLRHPAGR